MKEGKHYSTAVIVVKRYERAGRKAIMYYAVAGEIPNRNVVSQVIADNEDFVVGQQYEIDVIEHPPDPLHGRQFSFKNLGLWTRNALEARKVYGEGKVVEVGGSPEFTAIGSKKKDKDT